jgi:hypothetical protein
MLVEPSIFMVVPAGTILGREKVVAGTELSDTGGVTGVMAGVPVGGGGGVVTGVIALFEFRSSTGCLKKNQ